MSFTILRRFSSSIDISWTMLNEGAGLNYIYYKAFPEDYNHKSMMLSNYNTSKLNKLDSDKSMKLEINDENNSSTLAFIYNKVYSD